MENQRPPGESEAASQEKKETKVESSAEDRETRETAVFPLAEARPMATQASSVGDKLKSVGKRGPAAVGGDAVKRLLTGMKRFRGMMVGIIAAVGAMTAVGPTAERLTGRVGEQSTEAAPTGGSENAGAESPPGDDTAAFLSPEDHAAFLDALAEADKAIADAAEQPSFMPQSGGEARDPFEVLDNDDEKGQVAAFEQHTINDLMAESSVGGRNLAAGLMKDTRGFDGMNRDQIYDRLSEASEKYAKENGMDGVEAFNGLLDEVRHTATGETKAELSEGPEKMLEYSKLGFTNKVVDTFNELMDKDQRGGEGSLDGAFYDSLSSLNSGMQSFEDAIQKLNASERAHIIERLKDYIQRTPTSRTDEEGQTITDVDMEVFLGRLQRLLESIE